MYDKLLNQKLYQMVFDLNVTIKKGEILAIAGSSGSGCLSGIFNIQAAFHFVETTI